MEKDKRRISHVCAHLCTLSTRHSRGRTICLLLFSQTGFMKGVNVIFMAKTKINDQTLGEEITNSITHGVGALLSVAGCVIAIVFAVIYGTAIDVVSASLYGASLIILYVVSTMYHSLAHNKAKAVFRVLDHCSIFLLICGSYIPIALSLIGGVKGWVLFGIITGCTVVGIVFNAIDMHRWKKISVALYLLMGWAVVFDMRTVIEKTPEGGIWFLLLGGVAYTIGVIFYKMKKFKYMHSVWHLFVLTGSVLHYFYILLYIIKG